MSEHKEMGVVEKMISRRGFLKAGSVAMGTVVLGGVVAGCGDDVTRIVSSNDPGTKPDPGTNPGATDKLTFEQVNALRKKYVDSQVEYKRKDGTVVPVNYVKARALINSTGIGSGSELNDDSFNEVLFLFTEQEVDYFLKMPMIKWFTPVEFSVNTGLSEDKCVEILDAMAKRGLIMRVRSAGNFIYKQMPEIFGYFETGYMRDKDPMAFVGFYSSRGKDMVNQAFTVETPFYRALPISKDVLADESILPYDDWEQMLRRQTYISRTNCFCRTGKKIVGLLDPNCTHPVVECCMGLGEEAEYCIDMGFAHQITAEEAIETVKRNQVAHGMVVQIKFHKAGGSICCCHSDCCGLLSTYRALGAEVMATNPIRNNQSHYNLEWNKELCIKCGACKTRCPMTAVSMSETDGYPTLNALCIGCGQCGLTCPVKARKLTQRANIPELPDTALDDDNQKSEYRWRKGLIH